MDQHGDVSACMFAHMGSEGMRVGEAFRTLGTGKAPDTVMKGFQMSMHCESGCIRFLAIRVAAAMLLHLNLLQLAHISP